MENQIVWESRQPDIPRTIPKTLILYGPQRNPNEPPRPLYNKDLFFLKYGNTKEKKYILSLHKIHAEEFPDLDLEEKVDIAKSKEIKINPKDYDSNHKIINVLEFSLINAHGLNVMEKSGNEIYLMKADIFYLENADFKYLTKRYCRRCITLRSKETDNRKVKLMKLSNNVYQNCVSGRGFNEYAHNTIVDTHKLGLTYLYSKYEKRVMYLEEIVKFCDATLEKVLNEVKLRMFESKFLKKPPLLGELDQDIMKAYEREISKRLNHRRAMQR
ncbi:hypothetical protein Tco_0600556 [Tanacetum coccineum]